MKIAFDINTEDIMAFNGYYYVTDPTVRKQILRYRTTIPVLYIVIGAVLSYRGGNWNWAGLIIFGILALLWIFFWPMWTKRTWLKKVHKEIIRPENVIWFGKCEMEFDDEKVTTVTDKSKGTVLWSAFIKSGETKDYFFLFESQRQASVIPKQKITPAEVEELRSLFARHIAVNSSETKNKK